MLQVRFSPSFAVLLVLVLPCGGQHHVIGPSRPIVAALGDDVILPCRLDPTTDAFLMTVEWARPDLDPRFVFVWRGSVELESKKHPSYRRRTSLFTGELKHGNISLKLSRVKRSDEGRYRCFMPELNSESVVELVVGAASSPVVQMIRNSSGVVLQCESAGWYPRPEVWWLDGEGNLLSAGPTETSRGPDDLYTVISRVTVERHSSNFTCRVQQKNINQTREAHILVPDEFFADQSGSGSGSSAPAVIAALVVLVLVVAVVLGVWKWRRNRNKNKKLPEDEETTNGPEQESLLRREEDREGQTAERKTGSLDESNKETGLQRQTDEETNQNQDNNDQHAANEGAGTRLSVEQEGREAKTLQDKIQQRHTEDVKIIKDTDDGREHQHFTAKEMCSEDRQTEEETRDKQTERDTGGLEKLREETDPQSQPDKTKQRQDNNDQRVSNDGAGSPCSKEEDHDEQPTAGRDKLNDKHQLLMKQLKTKEREEKTHEDNIMKRESQVKEKQEQIKHVKQQLEDVDRRRRSAEDENRDTTDLERQKDELQKDLEKKQSQLERMEKDKSIFTQRKSKTAAEKEEIMKNLKEEEIRQQPSSQSREKKEDVNDPMEDLTDGMTIMNINDDGGEVK